MESFLTSLASNASAETTLASWELAHRGPWSVGLAIGLGVVLTLGAFFLYAVERGRLGILRSAILALLRTLVLAVILYLLLGPVLVTELEDKRAQGVVLLVDNSMSMKRHDRRLLPEDQLRVAIAQGLAPLTTKVDKASAASVPAKTPKDPARIDLVKAVLEHGELKLWQGLAKAGPVQPYLFGTRLHGPTESANTKEEPIKRLLHSLTADEATTCLGDALHEIIGRKDGDLPAAIVVFTDGLDNASKFHLNEVADKCRDLGVPLHIYGVGAVEGGTLQLREVGVPSTIFYDDTVHVPVRWRAQGFKQGTVEIILTLGGKEVARKERPVQAGEDLRDVLSFTPDKSWKDKGEKLDLAASIRLKEDNKIGDALPSRPVRLLDSKIKVLFIEGSPRVEFRFLQTALLRDRRIQPEFLLTNADSEVLRSTPYIAQFPGTRDKFIEAKYNLLILGDVPVTKFSKEQMEWIQEFVKKGGGLIVLAGKQHMPGSYDKSPLDEVLPVEVKPGKLVQNPDERTQEYPPTLTGVGERTDWLSLGDTPEDNRKLWEGLPGFHWSYPLAKLRPLATELAVNPRAKLGEKPMPILVQQPYGKGEVLFFATDETWRWRFNVADKHYARFWGQVIYHMGLPHLLGDNAERVHMALERSEAVLGQPGKIFVRLLDKDFNPRKDDVVEATLDYLDGKGPDKVQKIKLYRMSGTKGDAKKEDIRDGEYWQLLPHGRPGRYEIRLKNPGKSGEEETTFTYRVAPPPRHELEESGMAEAALRLAAQTSGGRFYREEDLYRLADNLKPRKASYYWREELDLFPLLMALFVLLITAEWLIRKFSDLS